MASVLAKASLDTSIQEALSRIVGGRVATVLLVWSIFAIFRIYKYWSTVTSPQRPQIRRTVATLPPTILLKASWNEVSNTNTNIEILWLQRPPLYLRIFNITKVLSSHLSISGGFEQDHDGKSCDFPTCLQCCNFFFYEFVTLQKAPLDTSQYQEALARWPGKSFSCLTVTRLVAQIPPAKTFQMPWILCTLYIVQYALFSCISCKQISGLPMQTDDAEG